MRDIRYIYIPVLGLVDEILELFWEDRYEIMKRSLDLIIDLGKFPFFFSLLSCYLYRVYKTRQDEVDLLL